MNTDVNIPKCLEPLLTEQELLHLKINSNLYGKYHNIKTFLNGVLHLVVNTPTPKRYSLLEFYIVLKLRNTNFLSSQQKTIINNYGRAFIYLKTGTSNYHDTKAMDKVIQDNIGDACQLNVPVPPINISKTKTTKQDITLEDILIKRLQLYRSALSRNLAFNLDDNDVRILLERKTCYYTGSRFKENSNYHRTVDRIDNKLGYVKGNVVACTTAANQIKNYILEDTRDNKFILTITQLKKMVSKL